MLRALVLDLDGTIVDTETAIFRAWEEVYRRRGARLPQEEWLKAVGSSQARFDPVAYLAHQLGQAVDRAQVEAEADALAAHEVRQLGPRPGVVELVHAAQAEQLLLAVASSSPRAWVDARLEQVGLAGAIPVRATADDVAQVKPAPDLFLEAARRLGIEPAQALVVEDSVHGARAALAAGMRCVVVPNPVTEGEAFPQGVAVLPSLVGWTPQALWTLACEAWEGQEAKGFTMGEDREARARGPGAG
ncbi:HAD family hydrolase [Limnochorda sp.]|uniref:HAD family hydrolase n=1 Tax=Limnochorda sp. TaxID=1940279 RepID=UPI001EB30D43|nr:haloacid dehalogenase [Bacillota bacterium]